MNRALLALLALLASAWSLGAAARASADLRVVATTADLAAVAREVGGSRVQVTALALPTQDPHFVDARPNLVLPLARADLLLAVGLDLEVGWLPTLQQGSRNRAIQTGARGYLECGSLVERLEVPTGRVDRSMGDVHGGGSPHYMLDPRRAVAVARGIASRMAELDPAGAARYRDGAEAFARSIDEARAGWERRLSSLRGAKVVAYHRSFGYLADWLGFEVVEHLEPRPGIPPNPRHVAQVLSTARARGVRLVLQESYYPDHTSRMVAEAISARVVRLPAAPSFRDAESYGAFMARVVAVLEG